MKWLSRLQHWLIEPHPALQDPLQRQRSAVLSLILLIVPTSYILFEVALYFFAEEYSHWSKPHNWIFWISAASFILYGLTRTRYHTLTIWLTILYAIAGTIVMDIAFAQSSTNTNLYYFATIIFAAGFIGTTRQILATLALAYSTLLVMAFVPAFSSLHSAATLLNIGIFMTITGFITLGARSVTHRLRKQQLESEEKLRRLFNAGGEAVLILRKNTLEILESNQTAQMLFSSSTDALDALDGKCLPDLLTTDVQETLSGYWQHPEGTPHILTLSHPSGAPLYVEARLSPYPSPDEDMLILSLSDATEKLHTYQALASSERRFQEIFNTLYQFTMLLNHKGKVIEANTAAQRALNRPLSAIRNRSILSFVNQEADSYSDLRFLLEQALKGQLTRGKVIFEDSQGKQSIFDCTLQPQQSNSEDVALIFSARDITEEIKLQERLQEIERRYEALFNRSGDAIFIFSTTGTIISANEQAAHFLHTTPEDIVGSDLKRFIVPNEVADTMAKLKALLDGQKVPVYRRVFRTVDEQQVVGEVSVMSVYDQQGKMNYIQSIVRDVTEREEQERIKLRYRLVNARNEMMGEFITAASHHFRTPLTTIKASLYLLPRLEHHPEKKEEHLGVLDAEVERLERLLEDLFLVVRLQRTTTADYQFDILLSSLVNDLRARQSAKSNYRNHQWRWELPESRETIQGNGEYIQRAMQNVLDNAVDYTPEGGTISVQIFEQDQWAVFEVLDTGIGITNDDMPRVGHDFFRADAAQERQHASPGLGLSIVRQIMHRHHGAILMESVPGQGTRVQLIWPTNSDWMPLEPEIPAQMLGDPSPFTRDTREQEEIILE